MNEIFKWIFGSVLAGACIGIAATTYLTLGGFPGQVMFAFGLMTVVMFGFALFTGRSGFTTGKAIPSLIPMLMLNIAGCALVAIVTANDALIEASEGIVAKRFAAGWLKCGILAIGCGFIMTAAVYGKKVKETWLPLIFGVPTFIICGFPHCIADVYYYTLYLINNGVSAPLLSCYVASVIGNYIGCNLYRIGLI
ncbi:MAG: formate/nitrite transporter family protein [Roseburia sp.]|nr:formate/nitrite transporter family protein [Roseburia sp.]